MKYKDEDPDNLGGLGDMLPADVLQKVNELLEQLHWTDHTNQGSKIEFVYVASGGQHVETQINIENPPKQPTTNPEKEQPLPNPLQKEREPRFGCPLPVASLPYAVSPFSRRNSRAVRYS